jgi:hypothetical protein
MYIFFNNQNFSKEEENVKRTYNTVVKENVNVFLKATETTYII